MIDALLKGKLSREQENMEDILTSNVFGLMRYLPPKQGLIPFLQKSVPFLQGSLSSDEWIPDAASIDYEFWPSWPKQLDRMACEPDLVLRVQQAGNPLSLVCIEAKYRSGKSSIADNEQEGCEPVSGDQLAREWRQLRQRATDEKRRYAILIYLTADYGMPLRAMNESNEAARDDGLNRSLYWLSWRHLARLFESGSLSPIQKDIFKLVDRMGFFMYEGIREIHKACIKWQLVQPKTVYLWVSGFENIDIDWRF